MRAMLSIKQAAEQLNVSEKTIRNLLDSGQLAFHRIGAGRGVIRIAEEALAAYLAECEVVANQPSAPRRRVAPHTLRHLKL